MSAWPIADSDVADIDRSRPSSPIGTRRLGAGSRSRSGVRYRATSTGKAQGRVAKGEGELDQHCQDDPLVPPAAGGVALGRADRVAVASLAVDRRAAVLVDGVVA